MVLRERVADNVYFFQSQLYARVNAGVIAGPDMAIVIDTLPFPEETLAMRTFIEQQLQVPVRYVINTHYHADHTWGNHLFPGAKIVSSDLCYQYLEERGIPSLERQQANSHTYQNTKIVLPHLTFSEGEFEIQIGKKNLRMFAFPGHSKDGIAVVIEEDRVMFAGDTLMEVPYIVDGDIEDMIASLKMMSEIGLESVVRGHGDIVLRGEVSVVAEADTEYLNEIRKVVRTANRRKYPLDHLEEVTIEDCGKSRVLLNGLAEQLHQQNMKALYMYYYDELPIGSEEYFE